MQMMWFVVQNQEYEFFLVVGQIFFLPCWKGVVLKNDPHSCRIMPSC